ncbi:PREDICTED: AP-4 complex accessory subunit tepsin isoform X6 [Chinchilla lanigera]|uniref:AP-4 complex accessory subunit tepsin isoform X6 n=1 Tax=Chinchilla lanigera TaxID=34839 RepID=UPI00038E9A6E|nr:PREDICTED: AP-4 complex accessory subunit tepsin isoform X6 [Chinchilla lanigera]
MIGESGPGGSGPGLGGGVIWTMAASPPLRDRLSFLHRLPILLKGTSDDDVPCPGYLFEEIAKISHESVGSSQCLLEYLLNRLNSSSGHVKLKVLKILLYLCSHGSSSFLLILRRNCALIQEATVFSGPPDPLHGNSLYQKVRAAAQDLGSTLFSDTVPLPPSQRARALSPTGMGSQSRPLSGLQGFGYSKERGRAGSAGEAFLSTIQRAAEVVVNAMHPGPENSWTQRPLPQGDTYQPAMTPSGSHSHPAFGNQLPGAIPGARAVRHQPGQAGGGWDELDSSPGSQSSSRNSDRSRASDSGSRSGSDSLSGASREPGDLAERAEAMALSDCQQELSLVRTVTQGPRAFLSREEAQHFIKECGLLNCEAVLELLLCQLGTASELEQMRALCAIASLGSTDLLPQEHILLLSRRWLQELSMGSPGPVTSKATKILRHFEASCGQRPLAPKPCAESSPAATLEGPSDLLTGPVPPSGAQVFLQPLSSTPVLPGSPAPTPAPDTSPLPTPGLNLAETPPAASREQGAQSGQGLGDTDTPGGGPSHCPWSRDSLFAGMELVACPRLVGVQATAEEPNRGPHIPQTWAERAAATEPPGPELSAFAFLNK